MPPRTRRSTKPWGACASWRVWLNDAAWGRVSEALPLSARPRAPVALRAGQPARVETPATQGRARAAGGGQGRCRNGVGGNGAPGAVAVFHRSSRAYQPGMLPVALAAPGL